MPKMKFEDVYVELLRDIYNAENQLLEALPKVAEAVAEPKLKKAVTKHLGQTEAQVKRLKGLFEMLGEDPQGKECAAMKGLIEEGAETISEMDAGPVRDAVLIVGAQKIEHYEIASYGSAITWAEQLGMTDHIPELEATLDEEKQTDEDLTQIAESIVNTEAKEAAGTAKR